MSAAGGQLRLVEPSAAVPGLVPSPRRSTEHTPTYGPIPEPAPESEGDRWRISGRALPVLADYGPDDCTGVRGLCGVCSGGRCENEPELDDEPEP